MKEIFYTLSILLLAAIAAPFVMEQAKTMGRLVAYNSMAPETERMLAFNAQLARHAGLIDDVAPADGSFEHGRVTAFNASLFDQANFSEELTTYALGYRDPENIAETLDFLAPEVESSRKPEFATFSSAEEFLSDGATDDLRAIGSDFKTVKYTSGKEIKKLVNRGLAREIDFDEVDEVDGWEERETARLIRRLDRNSLRRGFTLLSAAAVNANKTWTAAGAANPDRDIRAQLIAGTDVSGIRGNRVFFGDTSWDYRTAAYEGQDTAGAHAGAARTPEQVASFLNVDRVHVSKERYATGPNDSSLNQIVSNKVLTFAAYDSMGLEDPSNIKRLRGNVSSEVGGGRLGVHVRHVGDKRWRIAVEMYELIIIPATIGIRQITASNS